MLTKKILKIFMPGLFVVTAVFSLNINDVYAGFKFTPSPAPVAEDDNNVSVIPEITVDTLPQITVPDVNDSVMDELPVLPVEQGILPVVSDDEFTGERIEGFGAGIPLVIALRQIVPARYAFVFGEHVDLGVKTDWQGGKPWNEILKDLSEKHGFSFSIKDNNVIIGTSAFGQYEEPVVQNAEFSVIPSVMPEKEPEAVPAEERAVAGQPTSIIPENNFVSSDNDKNQEILPVLNKRIITAPKEVSVSKTDDAVVPPVQSVYSEQSDKSVIQQIIPLPQEPATGEKAAAEAVNKLENAPEPFLIEAQGSVWTAVKGDTLRETLQKWADAQNVSLVWNTEYDYPVQSDISIVGVFPDAVRDLLDGFASAEPKPTGKMYMNKPAGIPVLIVESNRITK